MAESNEASPSRRPVVRCLSFVSLLVSIPVVVGASMALLLDGRSRTGTAHAGLDALYELALVALLGVAGVVLAVAILLFVRSGPGHCSPPPFNRGSGMRHNGEP